MSKELPHIIPSTQPEVAETFATHQTTRQFYDEVQVRLELKAHCEWYNVTAQRHREELEKMRGEFNFFRFFRRS